MPKKNDLYVKDWMSDVALGPRTVLAWRCPPAGAAGSYDIPDWLVGVLIRSAVSNFHGHHGSWFVIPTTRYDTNPLPLDPKRLNIVSNEDFRHTHYRHKKDLTERDIYLHMTADRYIDLPEGWEEAKKYMRVSEHAEYLYMVHVLKVPDGVPEAPRWVLEAFACAYGDMNIHSAPPSTNRRADEDKTHYIAMDIYGEAHVIPPAVFRRDFFLVE